MSVVAERRRSWTAPPCASGKVAYRTRGQAFHALQALDRSIRQSAAGPADVPKATYKCPCGAWHLTRSTWGSAVRPPA